jgi:signal transduction histidine kinase
MAMQLSQLKVSLRSQISHELLTPLTCVKGLVDCLRHTSPSAIQCDYLDDIQAMLNAAFKAQDKIDDFIATNYSNSQS